MIYHFLELEADAKVLQLHNVEWSAEGPPEPPEPIAGNSILAITEPVSFRAPSATSAPFWQNGAMVWVETFTLAALKTKAIDTIDSTADAARTQVLVKQTNNVEYQVALVDAVRFRDAGFAGPVPRGVSSWTYAKRRQGWTDRHAAEDILATAQVWEDLLYDIRALRLDSKELVRDAATGSEIDDIVATFTLNVTTAMQGVQ